MVVHGDERGEFAHLDLDHYWTNPGSRPFLIWRADRWAGFALVRTGAVHDMSEFIVRKFAAQP
jgi:predicted acetyltransferase